MSKPSAIDYQTPRNRLRREPAQHYLPVILLAALGAAVWLLMWNRRGIGDKRWVLILLAGGMATIPFIGDQIARALRRISNPSRRAMDWTTIAIGFIACAYLIATAFAQDRDLFPKTHDECSYAIGMRMLASGRLWMPQLPVPDFFESFYILVEPKYCSKYFPGTALFFVPTVWLHWPSWLMPAMASGTCVALVYRIITQLIDGACGVLAALLMLSLSWFRMLSILLMSNVPMLLFALLLYCAWLQWRDNRKLRWIAAMGALAGWGTITRPIDAIAISLPIAAAVLYEMSKGKPKASRRDWIVTLACGLICAAPFLGLQLLFDKGVTGHAMQTPYGYYIDRFQPNTSYGLHRFDPAARAQTTLRQKLDYYQSWVKGFRVNHDPSNLPQAWLTIYGPMLLDTTLPCRALLILLPVGLLGLRDIRRWIFFAMLPLFVLLYLFSAFFLEHYNLLIAPVIILCVLLGARQMSGIWPAAEGRIFAALAAAIVMICITSFWEINRYITTPQTCIVDETFPSPVLRYINEILPNRDDVARPAVVLFTYPPGGKFFEEPVYNTDVIWPDDAPIIRAHDLGARNHEIFEYYAMTQPDRMFYRFDLGLAHQGKEPLTRLGTARELARIK